jgi:hypothetical protein
LDAIELRSAKQEGKRQAWASASEDTHTHTHPTKQGDEATSSKEAKEDQAARLVDQALGEVKQVKHVIEVAKPGSVQSDQAEALGRIDGILSRLLTTSTRLDFVLEKGGRYLPASCLKTYYTSRYMKPQDILTRASKRPTGETLHCIYAGYKELEAALPPLLPTPPPRHV